MASNSPDLLAQLREERGRHHPKSSTLFASGYRCTDCKQEAWPCDLSRALDCAIALCEGIAVRFPSREVIEAAGLAAWEGKR
jgi:hypothetical protein